MSVLVENTTNTDIEVRDLGITIDALGTYDISTRPIFDRFSATSVKAHFQSGSLIIRDEQGNPLSATDAFDTFRGTSSQITVVSQNGSNAKAFNFIWSQKQVKKNNWIQVGVNTHAEVGYGIPYDAILKYVTVGYSSVEGPVEVDLYVGTTKVSDPLITAPDDPQAGVLLLSNLNIPVLAGDKVRLRGGGTNASKKLHDAVITLFFEESLT